MENRNVYKGHRYVPKIMGEWNQEETYEGLSIVTNQGTSYTSKKRVPVGIDILDEEYWVVTGNYNAQVEHYRQEVKELDDRTTDNETGIENTNEQLGHTNDNIDTITLVGEKFGVKADGVTDDSDAIQYLLDNSDGVIQLPRHKQIYLEKPLIWGDSNVHEIDFGFSDILAPKGVIKINRQGRKIHQQKPTLKNGYLDSTQIVGDVKNSTAIEIGTQVEWGSSVRLDNLTIKGYKIGFYGNSLYELETMSVKFERCEIGMYLHSHESGNITDCSTVNDIYFDYNKYSLIISDCYNMTFNNMTIEHSDYGIVVTGYENTEVLFSNTYFEENIQANITTGRVNLNTLNLSQDGLGDTGLNGVKFEQTRYRPHTTQTPIFNEDFPFTSKYLEIGENFSERLLSGGELETFSIDYKQS